MTAKSTATGGAGGGGANYGAGGTAKALTTAYGTTITAAAIAHGGAGSSAGHASAKTKVAGVYGTFSASADTAPAGVELIQFASANASGVVDGSQSAKTKVVIGGPAQPFASQGQAAAYETAAPDAAASTAAVLAGNVNSAPAFSGSPSFFAIDELGGAYAKSGGTTSQDQHRHHRSHR